MIPFFVTQFFMGVIEGWVRTHKIEVPDLNCALQTNTGMELGRYFISLSLYTRM